jgi:hypothetical protein
MELALYPLLLLFAATGLLSPPYGGMGDSRRRVTGVDRSLSDSGNE